ncbi:immunity 51 family protein [Glycomyces sp. L485]|uniref:Imm51 family immunity protein n=1 Tax=Glycomyces sp. L485 TaxID=2909235 RepID=UPI001F4B6990|nr:Imm51 family immunity protein [Glycomyces sp. L485]MCH7233084.1 immunity 51 family protein [Glycomyces sp. L485]
MEDRPDFAAFPNAAFVEGETTDSVLFSPGGSADGHLAEVFAAHGLEGNGYDWQSAVHAALVEREPLLERFTFDSEAGMFCAYGDDREALGEVTAVVELFLAEPARLVEALEVASERDLFEMSPHIGTGRRVGAPEETGNGPWGAGGIFHVGGCCAPRAAATKACGWASLVSGRLAE